MHIAPSPKITILLVDDREENLISLEEILEKEGRTFLRATSGNEALKLILKNEDIGLIMLDVQMPDMDGFEVAKLLKSNAKTRDISIIFVTAINREEQYILKGFETGAVDYLQKPLDMNVCKAKVNVFEQLYFYQKELKRSVANVSKINKQLEQFMYIVAHDLKSPLSGIVGMLSVLNEEKEIADSPKLQSYVGLVQSAGNHLSQMISSILEYSMRSLTEQTIEEVDVDEMVRQIASLLFLPEHINIEIEDKLPTLYTRKLKLQQVFQNLISNAVKYNDKAEVWITVGVREKEEEYEFYVRDNGPGIQEADSKRIFNLFETTGSQASGESSTGVGLNIVKVIVEEQGGSIWVESQAGKGSAFYFTWIK